MKRILSLRSGLSAGGLGKSFMVNLKVDDDPPFVLRVGGSQRSDISGYSWAQTSLFSQGVGNGIQQHVWSQRLGVQHLHVTTGLQK